jgi:hypothetical protein
MELSLGDRSGIAGLIVGLFGIAAMYLWPEKKWIGWLCLVVGMVVAGSWLILEFRSVLRLSRSHRLISAILVGIVAGIASSSLWYNLAAPSKQMPSVIEPAQTAKVQQSSYLPTATVTKAPSKIKSSQKIIEPQPDAFRPAQSKVEESVPTPNEQLLTNAKLLAGKLQTMFRRYTDQMSDKQDPISDKISATTDPGELLKLHNRLEDLRGTALFKLNREYNSHYKTDAIVLRDKLLEHLEPGTRDSNVEKLYDNPQTLSDFSLVVSDFDRLTRLLEEKTQSK